MSNHTTGAQRTNARHDKIFEEAKRLKAERLNANFWIKGICRADLIEYIGEEEAPKLSDQDMITIANLMSDYLQEDYWQCLTETLEKLNIKRK